MKKVRTEHKPERSMNSFFENESSAEDQSLDLANDLKLLKLQENAALTDKSDFLLKLLKQVFLFLPGTFLLYKISFIIIMFLLDSFFIEVPVIYGISSLFVQVLVFGMIVLSGTLMTWFGLGDIKNKKHLAIPASVFATGSIIGAIAYIMITLFEMRVLNVVIDVYFFYLFPLVLIVPFLVKGRIDQKTEEI